MAQRSLIPALLLLPFLAACGNEGDGFRGNTVEAASAQGGRVASGYHAPLAGRMEAGYRLGSHDAPVAVVEFSDFGCPYCGQFARTTFVALHRQYIDAGLVRWRYVPVSFGFAGGALMGAAAICAAEQGGENGFWQAHDILYRHQTALRGPDAMGRMVGFLAEVGVDGDRLSACVTAPGTAAVLEENNRLAAEWLVRGTPTFLVNGVPMSGALPVEYFRKILDTALDPSGL